MSAKRIRELALSNSPTAQVKKTTATFDAGEILRGVQSQPDKRIQNSWSIALLFVICVTVVWELRTGLALSPFQLGAQRIEEGFFHPQQPHRVAGPMAEHAIAPFTGTPTCPSMLRNASSPPVATRSSIWALSMTTRGR